MNKKRMWNLDFIWTSAPYSKPPCFEIVGWCKLMLLIHYKYINFVDFENQNIDNKLKIYKRKE